MVDTQFSCNYSCDELNTLVIIYCLQGCYELVTSFIERNMGIIAGVTFGIAFSQVQNTLTTF